MNKKLEALMNKIDADEALGARFEDICTLQDVSAPGVEDPFSYNKETYAHYTYNSRWGNHAVAVVGWDDSYSKSNFLDHSGDTGGDGKAHQPPDNGAWIVKNSWGAASNQFPHKNNWGDDGYFYLSYYDTSIDCPETFQYTTEEYAEGYDYYYIDQYDFLPSGGAVASSHDELTSMANVFVAEDQRVRSLSCETTAPGTTVTYQLYALNEGYENPRDGTLLATEVETYPYGGYHRLELDEGCLLRKGQQYAVIVTEQASTGKYLVLVDRDICETYSKEKEYPFYAVGVVNKGESLFLSDGEWTDWTDEIAEIKAHDGGIYTYDNFPVKAYADPVSFVPGIVGMTEAEALAALEAAGFAGQAGEAVYSDTVEAGRVVSQAVAAGTEKTPGFAVAYSLSRGSEAAARLASTGDGNALPASMCALAGLVGSGAAVVAILMRRRREL